MQEDGVSAEQDARTSAGTQTRESSSHETKVGAARTLANQFFNLSYTERLKIIAELELDRDEDEGCHHYVLFTLIFERAAQERCLAKLWDAIRGLRLSEDVSVPLGPVAVRYRAGTYLNRRQLLTLRIVADSIEERPIYFTVGGGAGALGLGNWGVRQGLATKLVMRDLGEELPEGWVRGRPEMRSEVFDLERTLALVNDVYTYRGLRDRKIWQDRSTVSIPLQYQILFTQLADVAELAGREPEEVDGFLRDADDFRVSVLGGTRYLVVD